MSKAVNALKDEYERLYGDIPDDYEGQMKYLRSKYRVNDAKVEELRSQIKNLTWTDLNFSLPLIPKPASRPRESSDGHFYVPGAAVHRKYVQALIEYEGIAFTECKIYIDIYIPIPESSMTVSEIILAQEGLIRPISGGDWDNFAKTYCDSIQNLLIINDNIIVDGSCSKHYTIKPHVDIFLSYLNDFDCKYNKRKVTSSKSYKDNYEKVINNAKNIESRQCQSIWRDQR